MKDSGKWTDWFGLLLVVSFVLLIFRGGIVFIIFLWSYYLYKGWKNLKEFPSDYNSDKFAIHLIVGILVVIVSIVINFVVLFTY